ncbi:MAG: aspartyl/asparaginyl beta-hydroxylase domain-containing protein [Pseudomonadota bacterium]
MNDIEQGPESRPWVIRIGSKLRSRIDRISTASSKIPVEPLLSQEHFDWTDELAQNWQAIANEAEAIVKHREAIPPLNELSPDHKNTGRDGKWRSFFLFGYGYKVPENCLRAPKTAALVAKVPDLNSAFFSILDPGATIPRHRGVTRGLVTCHLGVKIPKDAQQCWIEVEGQKTHWQNGKWLVFDDCFEHQVANETDEMRVVLLVQVKRPMRLFGRLVHDTWLWAIRKSPFVQDARKNFDKWEEAFRIAEANEPA